MVKQYLLGKVLILAGALCAASAMADTVKMSGAGTVFADFVSSHKAEVEKLSGHTLQVVSSNSGKGLSDLASGEVDIAMVSEPLEVSAPLAEAAGTKVDASKVQFFVIKKAEVVFAVNPKNPVAKLSPEQVKGILTGQITNWKQVGGNDQEISIYAGGATDGTRAMVRFAVLSGADFSAKTKVQTSIKRTGEQVAADEGGFCGVGRNFAVDAGLKILDTGKKIERPLALATMGAPKPQAKAIIDAYTKVTK